MRVTIRWKVVPRRTLAGLRMVRGYGVLFSRQPGI